MKLLIQNNKVIATALDEYVVQSWEQAVIDAPADFDAEKMSDYVYVDSAVIYPAADINASKAKTLLLDSDWADLPSVRNTTITPHLLNGGEFDNYRTALRSIVVAKPAVVEVWPTKPDANWSVT